MQAVFILPLGRQFVFVIRFGDQIKKEILSAANIFIAGNGISDSDQQC